MNVVPSILTAVAMLMHSVWGCCLHHSHPETESTEGHARHSHPGHHHGHGCAAESEPEDGPEEHHEHEGCDESLCAFLGLRAEASAEVVVVSAWHDLTVDVLRLSTVPDHPDGRDIPPPSIGSGLLRALTQVWRV